MTKTTFHSQCTKKAPEDPPHSQNQSHQNGNPCLSQKAFLRKEGQIYPNTNPLEIFSLFWPLKIMKRLAYFTNRNYRPDKEGLEKDLKNGKKEIREITENEIAAWLGIVTEVILFERLLRKESEDGAW